MEGPEKLRTELPCDPAAPLLGMHLEKTTTQKDTRISVCTAAPLTIARTWKRPKNLPTDMHEEEVARTMDYHSAIKRVR